MSNERPVPAIVHEALGAYLRPDEIAVGWMVVIDVAGPEGVRYLAHRGGGGADGSESPTAWAALGMLRASMQSAEDQLRSWTVDVEDDEHPSAP